MSSEKAAQESEKILIPINEETVKVSSTTLPDLLCRLKVAGISNVQFVTDPNSNEPPRDGAIQRRFGIEMEQGFLYTQEGRLAFDANLEKFIEDMVATCKSTLESSPDCEGLILSHSEVTWGIDSVAPFHYVGCYSYYEYKIPASPQIQ